MRVSHWVRYRKIAKVRAQTKTEVGVEVTKVNVPGTNPSAVMIRLPVPILNSFVHGVPSLPSKWICCKTTF